MLLFLITLFTTTAVGAAMQYDFAHNVPFDLEHSFDLYMLFWHHPAMFLGGLAVFVTLLAILLAHEFGHYIAALVHGVDASLPYFLPSPGLGTFGAFIRVRSPIYSKRVLFDIGVAGPLAGFVFILPALAIGLAFSKVIPGIAHHGDLQFGSSARCNGCLTHAIFPGVKVADLYLHPMARAAWVGMFMTAMNLLPIGQLDGGHILYSFFPQAPQAGVESCCAWPCCRWAFSGTGGLFGERCCYWSGGGILRFTTRPISDPERRRLGWIALAVFLLCFSYAPIATGGF